MKKIWIYIFLMTIVLSINAQDFSMKVWPNGAPNHNGMDLQEEEQEGHRFFNVSEAEMFVYLPKKEINTGAAVVICPGGGYMKVVMGHEGYDIAQWLSERGVAAIVLKYRLPYGHHEIPSLDARRTLKIVRTNADKWGIDTDKIGVAGSSAGGHLASTVGTRFDFGDANASDPIDKVSSKPDFMLLLYPVITFNPEFRHTGSRNSLIGKDENKELEAYYSNELHVSENTPPTFLVLADDDRSVVPKNSVEFYLALKKHNIPAEMHIFKKGGHGFGMHQNGLPVNNWPSLFYDWLKSVDLIY